MKRNKSAGIILFRKKTNKLEVMLLHPGGPFWKNKDIGAWSIPKGEFTDEEDPLEAARREFKEETGSDVDGDFIELKSVKLKSGKIICAWAVEGDLDVSTIVSNTIMVEWPPRSGKQISIPECDRGEWLCMEAAYGKINPGQAPLLEELKGMLGYNK